MTKLSEKLAKLADAGGTLGPVYGVMADDARAIEERAEAAEAKLKWHEETQRTYYDVEARAATAEAEAARLRDAHAKALEWAYGLAAANTKIAAHATLNDEAAERLADERDEALARAKAAEAEIVRLRERLEDILDIVDGTGGE